VNHYALFLKNPCAESREILSLLDAGFRRPALNLILRSSNMSAKPVFFRPNTGDRINRNRFEIGEEEIMSTLALTTPDGAAALFARSWWTLLLRGLLAIVLGALAFTQPFVTLSVVVMAFAIYCLVEGIASLFAAITGWRHRENRMLLVLEGIVGIAVAIITLRTPAITTTIIMAFIAVWALVTGVLRIVEGVQLRREIRGEAFLIIGGLVSIAFAVLVLLRPFVGAIAVVRVLGAYAVILGLTELFLGFEVRRIPGSVRTQPA
jgi:uncharacterized membrane protein HdeD (DUF308 family)